jgi:N-acyl-D-amino-acid deacylase
MIATRLSTPLFAIVLIACATACTTRPDFDLLVRGGTMYDGTGEMSGVRRADVGVRGDRIVAIGNLDGRSAQEFIDATGKAVAPGFIDAQGRSGLSLLADGSGESHLRQGITSEMLADGSPALWTAPTADTLALGRYGITLDWSGLQGYFEKLESRGTAINVGTLIPLSIVRATADRAAFIDAAMRDGAFGLIDDVGASEQEIVDAATVVGRHDGMVMARAGSVGVESDEAVLAIGAQARRMIITGLSRALADRPASELIGRMLRVAPRNVFVYGATSPYAAPGESATALDEMLKFGGTLIGTDTSAMKAPAASADSDPAAFGAFPRFLARARDEHLIESREAVRRATSAPASVFQISQRGIIRENYYADLVVFDAGTVADRATGQQPQYPAGIEYVIVNGVVELTPRGLTGSRAGTRLVHRPVTR